MSVGGHRRRAVAVGGGTGLPLVLRYLVDAGYQTTAVVTMADDGGSSGVLRRQLGMLPPGDVRNCLVALADPAEAELARVLQYRFAEGEGLAGHALGNLVLAALSDLTGDFDRAVDIVAGHLRARGRVIPSTLTDVRLHGVDRSGSEVFGQARLAANPSPVSRVYLEPAHPPAHPDALVALREADVVVIGPGSLYTSVIPNFLVAGIAEALRDSRARRVYVCNVANMRGETAGLDAGDHVEALVSHGMGGCIDVVVVHACADSDGVCDDAGVHPVEASEEALARIRAAGIDVVSAPLADREDPHRHDPSALAAVLEEVLG